MIFKNQSVESQICQKMQDKLGRKIFSTILDGG